MSQTAGIWNVLQGQSQKRKTACERWEHLWMSETHTPKVPRESQVHAATQSILVLRVGVTSWPLLTDGWCLRTPFLSLPRAMVRISLSQRSRHSRFGLQSGSTWEAVDLWGGAWWEVLRSLRVWAWRDGGTPVSFFPLLLLGHGGSSLLYHYSCWKQWAHLILEQNLPNHEPKQPLHKCSMYSPPSFPCGTSDLTTECWSKQEMNPATRLSHRTLIWLMYFLYKNEYRIFKPIEITTRKGLK
jgi:hypothetical protein